ncbi:pyrroline-5-carboxylate reductase [Paenibacillus sp. J2TS4]|uniref:pyrroline-5-carboxylate reductase n=1 Tax=Paenibacillus sp. J2TS4 TaxID=2807194 RepID=UPI001B24F2E8|nr:pyrroline-5-carboxylate reductase [Paenibacillus sp. J2TS4]GIP32440.1 pyrroline-5-carboxylate reductase [Paenibacillus sp. J2TS4]
MSHQLLAAKTILFIGAGPMAEAIIRGLVSRPDTDPERIIATNRSNRERLAALNREYGIRIGCGSEAVARYMSEADLIVLAMKPKDVGEALVEIAPSLDPRHLLISVVAGLSLSTIEGLSGGGIPIARCMPNTSSTIGLGATGLCFSSSATSEHQALALDLFAATGETVIVEEPLIDVVTGVSGSGPAYIYYMMEAMMEAGIAGGLDEEQARLLTVQTVLGAASMVKATGEDPAALRRKVTSPNGTTQAALEKLDEYRFHEAVRSAVHRASERAGELGRSTSAEMMKP